MKIYFKVDANKKIGFGHLARTVALANYLEDEFQCYFVLSDSSSEAFNFVKSYAHQICLVDEQDGLSEIEIIKKFVGLKDFLVLDGYQYNEDFNLQCRKLCHKLIRIDDMCENVNNCDVIINHNLNALDYSFPNSSKNLLGPDYLMLRQEFFCGKSKTKEKREKSKILLSLGGSDPLGFTEKLLSYLIELAPQNTVDVILGANNDRVSNLKSTYLNSPRVTFYHQINATQIVDLIKKADLMICPASMTAWEAVSVGVPLIVGYFAQNQVDIAHSMEKAGVASSIGLFSETSKEVIMEKIKALDAEDSLAKQRSLVDGCAPRRMLDFFKELI